jgi:hypothetical protein
VKTADLPWGRLRGLHLAWSWRRFWNFVRLAAICAVLLVVLQFSVSPPDDLYSGAGALARDSLFNYVAWEADALAGKLFDSLFGVESYIPEAQRSDFVRAYMADLSQIMALQGQIDQIYSDPDVPDPDAASADLRAERDSRRAALEDRQGTFEGILESQISAVLVDEGLGTLGQVLPPLALHFTPLPDVLIISPRDEIRVAASLSLNGLTADQRNTLENTVDARFDVSSLVVDIGGMALYPSMLGETDRLSWAIETASHEWVHHYLFFFPLGLNYFDGGNPDTRIINETTAELLGKEIALKVYRRYYPELVPPEPTPEPSASPTPTPTPDPDAPPIFDFAAEMNTTRVTVDRLLAAGQVDEAEAYMRERQAFFHDHGYALRKLNQAFFAFYGGYQAEGADQGTAGEDPIGPAVRTLRDHTGSVADFLAIMRGITTRTALLAEADHLSAEAIP